MVPSFYGNKLSNPIRQINFIKHLPIDKSVLTELEVSKALEPLLGSGITTSNSSSEDGSQTERVLLSHFLGIVSFLQ